MRILIFGGNGMLGHKLVQQWENQFEVFTTVRGNFSDYEIYKIFDKRKTFENVDVNNISTVENVVRKVSPNVIFNAAGIIKQLPTSKNVVKTLQVNSIFPHLLAEIAERYNSRLINISTDCVFNGKKGNYTEEDISDAEDVYGKSKNLGEVSQSNCLTLRTSIIGRELNTNHSLVEWFLSRKEEKVRGFVNAIYTGFPTIILSEILAGIITKQTDLKGLYHISSEPINKFDLLNLIKEAYKIDIEIEPFENFYIDRSLNSEKFRKKTGFMPEDWRNVIQKMAEDSTNYDLWRKKI